MDEEVVCQAGAPEWVVTYGDMMSLLLTFFILLLSFTDTDAKRFKDLMGSIQDGFGVPQERIVIPMEAGERHVRVKPFQIEFNARRLVEKLKRELDPFLRSIQHRKVDVEVYVTFRGVAVLMPTSALFLPATDELNPRNVPLLQYIAEAAKGAPGDLAIEVRATDTTPRAESFADVWELTTRRSVTLSQWLRAEGHLDETRLRPSGRGASSPGVRPGRRAPDESVEFLFLAPIETVGD